MVCGAEHTEEVDEERGRMRAHLVGDVRERFRVAFEQSIPSPRSTVLAESYGSDSSVTRPLNFGSKKSETFLSSRPVFLML